ncbi:Ala-tRNA(Pro) hydrolase [Pseudoroseomonas rhizosphaerae]|uniref:Alanine--tRNA ligase n=1 Tax=Teichococcus rhizosphaerae TaxID=1335062 RepID=A0A2C7AFL3_9PROT|nr:alanyl-tRNA editing protein [Pseudoroseomonas rhizosphaerae]PHK96255.1 Ala-tRNA(Pro) hydrolase [Pseudoroseomonas rhizosphaerae]
MTEMLFRTEPYARECTARVVSAGPEGVVLDRTVFYAQGGGQPGDAGLLRWEGAEMPPGEMPPGEMPVTNAVKGENGTVLHVPAAGAPLPAPGAEVTAVLDWERRHRLMRMHTTLHLLCSLIPGAGVTGGQIGVEKSRLDFDLAEPPTKEWLSERLTALAAEDHAVGERWITEAELDENPNLVRTLSVKPPRGAGQVRLVRIGAEAAPVDLQPCGGTHVARTGEIGAVTVAKLENKGKQNRRVYVTLEG